MNNNQSLFDIFNVKEISNPFSVPDNYDINNSLYVVPYSSNYTMPTKEREQHLLFYYNRITDKITNERATFVMLSKHSPNKKIYYKDNDKLTYREKKTKNYYFKDFDALKDIVFNETEDKALGVYCCPNPSYRCKPTTRYIHKLSYLFIDIDFHTVDNFIANDETGLYNLAGELSFRSIDLLYNYLESEHFGRTIPLPSLVVYSGRGLHLYYKLQQPLSNNSRYAEFWQNIENLLINNLKEQFDFYNAEVDTKAKNRNRQLRVPGSLNTSINRYCRIYAFSDVEYSLSDLRIFLRSGVLQEKKIKKKRIKTKQEKISQNAHLQTEKMLKNRLSDLDKLISLRKGNLTGNRELLLHIANTTMCTLSLSFTEKEKRLKKFNNMFLEPLQDSEVNSVLKSTKVYKYTNNRIISDLKITLEEQRHLKTIISENIKTDRKNLLKEQEKHIKQQQKEQEKEEFINNVIMLYKLGQTQKQIAEELKCSVRKIQTIYKEQGLSKIKVNSKYRVIELKQQGFTQQQVADILKISKRTVQRYWNQRDTDTIK